jgi:hypothetical protein
LLYQGAIADIGSEAKFSNENLVIFAYLIKGKLRSVHEKTFCSHSSY